MTLRFVATKDWSGSSRLLRKKPALQSLWLWEQHWFCFRATAERPKYQVKNCLCVKTFQSISRDTVWCMNDFQTYTAELIAKAEPGRKRNLQIRKGNGKMKSILQRRKKGGCWDMQPCTVPQPSTQPALPFLLSTACLAPEFQLLHLSPVLLATGCSTWKHTIKLNHLGKRKNHKLSIC